MFSIDVPQALRQSDKNSQGHEFMLSFLTGIDSVVKIPASQVSTRRGVDHHSFTYHDDDSLGPGHWDLISSNCDGSLQSPIDIQTENVERVSKPPLIITGFSTVPDLVTLSNNGHSVVVNWSPSNGLPATFSGGVLPEDNKFIVDGAHFHWGPTDCSGSEHLIDGKQYSLEMHIVSFNSKYGKHLSNIIR